jgi:hypothetical protein
MGLPESIDSRTANSRERSCRILEMRNRYLARSRPESLPQVRRWARRAARTARSTSGGVARATLASGCSVAGSIETNVSPPVAGTNRPLMNRP